MRCFFRFNKMAATTINFVDFIYENLNIELKVDSSIKRRLENDHDFISRFFEELIHERGMREQIGLPEDVDVNSIRLVSKSHEERESGDYSWTDSSTQLLDNKIKYGQ
ncbi:uncharacterized protein [Centruroides vittatus]|uniref:uncharacterized protein n=1 Tax=Centruroides vittatus TaxID=120091 RepID=UPI00351038F2